MERDLSTLREGGIRSDPSVQVKRVSVSLGATPLGRRPRRTKRVGASAPVATASRAWPMPSVRQRSDRPTTSRRASRAASSTPVIAGGDENRLGDDSDHLLHEQRRAGESRLASRRPTAGSALVPRSRSVVPSDWASQAATSIADQSCSTPPNGVTIGPVAISPPPTSTATSQGARSRTTASSWSGRPLVQEPRGSVEKHEIDVVLGGEPHGVHAWLARGVDGDAGRDALLRERVSALGERGARGRKLAIVAQEPSQDELARGPSSERLGDHKQVVEALRVGRDDQDRALSRRRGRLLRGQLRILAKDRLLELVQGRARLDAELVDEQPPCLAIDLECLGLATRAVERLHERRPQPLAEGMLTDERLDLTDELCEATEREVGFDPPLERHQAELFQAESLRLRNDSCASSASGGPRQRSRASRSSRAASSGSACRASSTSSSKRSRSSSSGPTRIM